MEYDPTLELASSELMLGVHQQQSMPQLSIKPIDPSSSIPVLGGESTETAAVIETSVGSDPQQQQQLGLLTSEVLRQTLLLLTNQRVLFTHCKLGDYFGTLLLKDLEVCNSGAEQAVTDIEKIGEERASYTQDGNVRDEDEDEDPLALSISLHTDQTAIKQSLSCGEQALSQFKVRRLRLSISVIERLRGKLMPK